MTEQGSEYFTKQLSLQNEDKRFIKSTMEFILPPGDDFVARYEDAINQLSEFDPVSAFELRRSAVIPRLLSGISAMEKLDGISAEEMAEMESMLKVTLMPVLEKAIKELARLHGRITKWRVEVLLNSTLAMPPEFQQYLQNVQAAKSKQLSGQSEEKPN